MWSSIDHPGPEADPELNVEPSNRSPSPTQTFSTTISSTTLHAVEETLLGNLDRRHEPQVSSMDNSHGQFPRHTR